MIIKTAWTTRKSVFDDAFLCIAQADNYELTFVTDENKENYKNNYTTPIVYDGKVLNVDIATGKQLFGDQNGEKTGFEELMKYDSNSDGFINEQDPVFKHLLLWSDLNKNGRVDYYKANCSGNHCECDYKTAHEDCLSPELKTLSDIGISSISTGYTTEYDNDNVTIKTDEHGNLISYVGEFIRNIFNAIGELVETVTNKIVDVFFKTENS